MVSLNKCLCTELPIAGHHLADVDSFVAVFEIEVFEMFRQNFEVRD